jgi:hypothetical protein
LCDSNSVKDTRRYRSYSLCRLGVLDLANSTNFVLSDVEYTFERHDQ